MATAIKQFLTIGYTDIGGARHSFFYNTDSTVIENAISIAV